MTQYTVSLSLDDDTRNFLLNQGYSLSVFKGVNAGQGAKSTVWVYVTGDALYNQSEIDISWQEDLYIGETTTQLQNDVVVSGTNPFTIGGKSQSVKLGKNYIYEGQQWNPNPTQSPSGTFSIENSPNSVNNFYVSQTATIENDTNKDPNYIVVQSILGSGGIASFIPIETISMILSTKSVKKGTIITKAFSPGLIITLTGRTSINISYDMHKGWVGPSGSTSSLGRGDSIYDSMLNNYNSTFVAYANSVQSSLKAIELERGISSDLDYGFTAKLIFGTLAVATWAYNNYAIIASATNVVISSVSNLEKAICTFTVIGKSALACATALATIAQAIKDKYPQSSQSADDESSSVDVRYKLISCNR